MPKRTHTQTFSLAFGRRQLNRADGTREGRMTDWWMERLAGTERLVGGKWDEDLLTVVTAAQAHSSVLINTIDIY